MLLGWEENGIKKANQLYTFAPRDILVPFCDDMSAAKGLDLVFTEIGGLILRLFKMKICILMMLNKL